MNRQSLIKAVYALNCEGIATKNVIDYLKSTCKFEDYCNESDHMIFIYDCCEVYVDQFNEVIFM